MTFTIPNKAVTFPFQSRVFQSDFDILAASVGGKYGVISTGCAITASVVPAMTVELATGQVNIDGVRYDVVADTLAVPDADLLLPRFDTVVIGDDTLGGILQGIADAAPYPPSPAADQVGLAQLFVPAAGTAIATENIVDKRVPVPDPTAATSWTRLSATTDLVRSQQGTRTFDTVLAFAAQANTKYRVRGAVTFLIANGSSNTLSVGVHGPLVPTFFAGHVTYHYIALGGQGAVTGIPLVTTSGFGYNAPFGGVSSAFSGTAYAPYYSFEFIIQNGANAGTVGIAWGQAVANALTVTRMAGSYLEYEVV